MNKQDLILIYGSDIEAMTRRILEEADLQAMIPGRSSRIGIKPNLVSPSRPEDGATTHPQIIGALIGYLQDHGFMNITVMEGSWVGDKTEDSLEVCGYYPMLEKYQVPFVDMQKEKGVAVDCGVLSLNICASAMDVDFLINVPVLKGHCQTKITCALKNLKGLLPNSEKRRFHRMGLHDPIGHLSLGLHQDFILVDSICGDLTFEDGGNPVYQGRIIAAADPVLCDALGCRVIGLEPDDVEYICVAHRLGVGEKDLSKAAITMISENEAGLKTSAEQSVQEGWKTNKVSAEDLANVQGGYRHVCHLADNVCEVESCSACYGYLIPALEMLEKDGILDQLNEKVCIGQGYRTETGELGVGNCTRKFRHTLEGCPPTENQMYEFLKEYIVSHKKKGE